MTIDSRASFQTFNVNATRRYVHNLEAIAFTIYVYEVDANDALTLVSFNDLDVNYSGQPPIFDGGTVQFLREHTPGTVKVLVKRQTGIEQKIDYQAYDPFPAETHEFALDKLTLICQEIEGLGGDGTDIPDQPTPSGAFIPLSGTAVGKPVTGPIQHTQFDGGTWNAGVIGGGFDGYWIYTTTNSPTGKNFGIANQAAITVFDEGGNWSVALVQDDANTGPQDLITKQFLIDYSGGEGAAFIPLSGTAVGADVTGPINFENTTLSRDGTIGILENVTDVMTLYSNGDILVATGADIATQWFAFGENGQLNLPDIDYSQVDPTDAVNKAYVDSVAGGGGGAFVPLAGTTTSDPITGNFIWRDVGNNQEWVTGVSNVPGFTDGFSIAAAGTSGDPSNIYLLTKGTTFQFRSDFGAFYAPKIVVGPDIGDPGIYEFAVNGQAAITQLVTDALVTAGLIDTGGATFEANVTIDGQLTAQGVLCDAIVSNGHINTGNIASDTYTVTDLTPNSANNLTSKSYVDGLNNSNVKTSGNQTISGQKTFTSQAGVVCTNSNGLALTGLSGGGSNQLLGVGADAFGNFVFAAGPATVLEELPAQLEAANAKIAMLEAKLSSIESRLLGGGL